MEFWLSGQTIQQCWFVLRFCAFPCLFVFHYPECLFKICRSLLRGSNCAKLGKSYLQTWNEIIQRKRSFSSPSCDLLSLSIKIKYRENISVEIDWPWWQGLIWKLAAVSVGEQINWSDKTFDQNQLRFPADRPPPISIFLNYVRSHYCSCDSRVGKAFCGKTIFQK